MVPQPVVLGDLGVCCGEKMSALVKLKQVKSRKWNFLKIFIEVNCYTGTYWKTRPNSVSRSMREHTSGFFWNSHGWCRIFRRIFWYHRLLPKKCFLSSYLGFRPFFWFWFLARYSKTANFRDMVPTLRSTFFSISYKMACFFGVFLQIFWKKGVWPSPYFLVLGRGQEGGNWHVTVWIFEYIHDEISLRAIMTEVKMADGSSVEEGIIIGNALKVKCNETKM